MLIPENPDSNANAPQPAAGNPVTRTPAQALRILSIVVSILTGLAAAGMVGLFILRPAEIYFIVIGVQYALVSGLCILGLKYFYKKFDPFWGAGIIALFFGAAIITTATLLSGTGFLAAFIFLIFALTLASMRFTNWQSSLLIAHGILVAGAAALLTSYSPFAQVSIPLIGILTPGILVVLFVLYMIMLARQMISAPLHVRIVSAILSIVIIPLVILSVIQSQSIFSLLTNEVNQALELTAEQTASSIDSFLDSSLKTVQNTAQLDIFAQYLAIPANQRPDSAEEKEMRLTLQVLDTSELDSTVYISSYALLDVNGYAVYDTLSSRIRDRFTAETIRAMGIDVDQMLNEGINEGAQQYFQVPAQIGIPYISPLQITASTRSFFYISAPVRENGKVIGVLRARYDGLLLQDLLRSYNGLLGQQSYAILLDENNIRLADAYTPNYLYKAVAPFTEDETQALIAEKRLPDLPAEMTATNFTDFDQILRGFNADEPVFRTNLSPVTGSTEEQIGAIAQVRSMPWKVVYLRTDYNEEELRSEQRKLTTLVTAIIASLVGLVTIIASQLISRPIIQLTNTAQEITEGNLNAQAPVNTADEFGLLGNAFNSMTAQLRASIVQLEERVRARTQEVEQQNVALANRARQFQTVSEVARQVVSSQDLETLLSLVTQLVSERFAFYHVGIFLLDDDRQRAVLRAANSEGGQRMLARRHSLAVGKVGIVGYATGTGQARIATDVGADAVYFNNPDLPMTRSEMALPLKAGGQVIGALDIQSTESNAFHDDDIELFTTLADQIAIAIYNNQLYTETLRALDEAQKLHRQYLRSEWAKDTASRKALGYLFNQSGISEQQAENPLWKKVFSSGEAVYAALPGGSGAADHAIMAIPISVRGETIGVIHVQDQGKDRLWSEDEISVVNSIASQVAVALENARLFESTVQRAEREMKAHQITAKIRATNNPEEMMQIAISELQQALHASRAQIYIRQETAAPDRQTHGLNSREQDNGTTSGKPAPHSEG